MKNIFLISTFIIGICQAQNPLFIPPILIGNTFNLNVQAGTTQFFAGINTPTYGVNGSLLAPTLLINKGDLVTLNVTNSLPNTSTTMHWHGLHVAPENDGGPHQIIPFGTTWSPTFTMLNDAGTFWYHPHGENKTDIQVSKGIAGMIIVKDAVEAALPLPRTYGIDDLPLIVQTKCFDILHQIATATVFDTVVMVNGTRNAYQNIPAQVVRLRLLNGASDRSFMFGFSNNMNFHQIATDAGLLTNTITENRLRLSPGERAEILVDFAAMQGDSVQLMSFGSELATGIIGAENVGNGMASIPDYDLNPLNGADFPLLKMYISAPTANAITAIPTNLTTFSPWNIATANVNRTLTFSPEIMGPQGAVEGPFLINNVAFNMDSINIESQLNNTEIWTLNNQTQVAHPFHIHDTHFFVTEINGGAVPANQQGKKDVVLVMPMQTLKFIIKFEDFADETVPYMYHCHLLHHEDDGMMGSFLVKNYPTSILDIAENEGVKIYPNPISTGQSVKIEAQKGIQSVFVYDMLGKKVAEKHPLSQAFMLEMPFLTGIYTILVQIEGDIIMRKISVE